MWVQYPPTPPSSVRREGVFWEGKLEMLIFVQFPIADIRLFTEAETGRLHSPLWPSPKPYQEFIRSFGIVRRRGKGGIQGWIGENEICDASHAIKINKPITYELSTNKKTLENTSLRLKSRSRHFYFDGMAVAKFEIVFVTTPARANLSPKLFSDFMVKFLKTKFDILDFKDSSEKKPATKQVPLDGLGKHLSNLYLYSTTKKSHIKELNKKWTIAGDPIFWIEFSPDENLPIPPQARLLPSPASGEVTLYHWDLSPQENKKINVWLTKYHTASAKSRDSNREARILLTRLNAEHETLWAVLNMIEAGEIGCGDAQRNTSASNYLQYYFNEATRRVFKLQKSREKFLEPGEVGPSIRASLEYINPGRQDSLLQKLQLLRMRPQVTIKVKKYIQIFIKENFMGDKVKGDKFSGDKVGRDKYSIGQAGAVGSGAQAKNINFYNTPITAETDIDLKQLAEELKKLRKEMKRIASDASHDAAIGKIATAEEAAKNSEQSKVLETLGSVGEWALGIAEKIAIPLATAVIKSALGMQV